MSLSVEELEIKINSDASTADDAIDRLVSRLDKLIVSLGGLDSGKLVGLANGVQKLGTAMQTMKEISKDDFADVAKNIKKLASVDTKNVNAAAQSLYQIGKAFNNIGNISDGAKQIAELANGIKQLGYRAAKDAVKNIPLLSTAMKNLMTTLSTVPKVSQNLIDMTNALAKLARTGASSGKAATSLSNALNSYSKSTTGARAKTFSLASAIGKLYATYWLLLRALNLVKESINIASDITEVQNVVDTTFGEYAGLVDKMSETSIQNFGMSELTVKQVASRFQAMGTAMGFTRGQMADMSIELTKLTADMSSFYNVEQSAVAEDLASILTGQSRPLRTYGLDLTEATLAEWAMKQGMDANISSMTQAEKTLLRYQYVMANTGAAQGDFQKTQMTWANQVRILNENFRQLGGIIGGTLINAFKPFVVAMNSVISAVIKFAKVVSDALGAIFGWEYQVGGGGIASDLETAESAAGGISDGVGGAADNAKKLKQQLAGIDELNVLKSDSASGGGGGGGGGGASGGAETDADGGQWVQTESIWEKYTSSLDSLYKLGEYISTTLTSAMASIDWDSVYKKAENFGTGLAEFLNGLIRPDLFYMVGRTIANSLNTAVTAGLAFAEEFDFYEFGESIGTGITTFFTTFDWNQFADSINAWVDGLKDTLAGFLKGLKWTDIVAEIGDFLGDLELDTIFVVLATLELKKVGTVTFASGVLSFISQSIASALAANLGIELGKGLGLGALFKTIFTNLGTSIGGLIKAGGLGAAIKGAFTTLFGDSIFAVIGEKIAGIAPMFLGIGTKIITVLGTVGKTIVSFLSGPWGLAIIGAIAGVIMIASNWDKIVEGFAKACDEIDKVAKKVFGAIGDFISNTLGDIKNTAEKVLKSIKETVSKTLENVKKTISDVANNISKAWSGLWDGVNKTVSTVLEKVKTTVTNVFNNVKNTISTVANNILASVSTTFNNVKSTISTVFNNIKSTVSSVWNSISSVISGVVNGISSTISNVFSSIKSTVSNVFNSILSTAQSIWNGVKNAITTPIKSAYDVVSGIIQKIKNFFNQTFSFKIKLPKINISYDTTHWSAGIWRKLGFSGAPKFNLSWVYYKDGGFPIPGSYFVAGENGVPEMLGTVGGRTAVASGAEITGIRDAVMSTGQEEIALLRQQNQLLLGILNKEFGITTDDIGRSARKYAKEYYKRTGNEAYSF